MSDAGLRGLSERSIYALQVETCTHRRQSGGGRAWFFPSLLAPSREQPRPSDAAVLPSEQLFCGPAWMICLTRVMRYFAGVRCEANGGKRARPRARWTSRR